MRVLILSAAADTGGVGAQLASALRDAGHDATAVCRSLNYIEYPHDVLWPVGEPMPERVAEAYRTADVLHVMESWDACRPFEGWQDRPLVLHHHGSIFRGNHEILTHSAVAFRAERIVSTPDLALIDPGAEWLPNPVDAGAMRAIRREATRHDAFTIAHTPTNRRYKSTGLAERAAEAAGVALDVVENQTWAESLRRKASADAVFDQLRGGYALSGLEAMAMGIPVIGGANDPELAAIGVPGGTHLLERLATRWGYLPFLNATDATLSARMAEIRDDTALHARVAEVGEYHAHRWHDPARVAQQLVAAYERAIEAKR